VKSLVNEVILLPVDGTGKDTIDKKISLALNQAKFQDNYIQSKTNEVEEEFMTMSSIIDFKVGAKPGQLVSIHLSMSQSIIISDRRVYSILDCLGDVGGLYDAVTLIAAFLVGSLANDIFTAEILKTLFKIAKPESTPPPSVSHNSRNSRPSQNPTGLSFKRRLFDFRFIHLIQKNFCFQSCLHDRRDRRMQALFGKGEDRITDLLDIRRHFETYNAVKIVKYLLFTRK